MHICMVELGGREMVGVLPRQPPCLGGEPYVYIPATPSWLGLWPSPLQG
jgi:hypothetical protein